MKLATLCYLNRGQETLMIHRVKKEGDLFKDFWNGLGGKMEVGEDPFDCVIREFSEESGLRLKDPQMVGIITFPNNRNSGETWHVFVFTATQFEGELNESTEGELHWIPNDQVLRLNLQEADHVFIPWIQEKKPFFVVKFLYQGDKLVDHQVHFRP